MASYSADTDLARELAAAFITAADTTDDIGASAVTALALSELESESVVEADELSDQLERAGVVVRQQADLLDGLDIDLDEFAEQLDQDPDELARQLQTITELGLGAEAGILPLVLWEGTSFTPETLRAVFIGLPEPGVDAELDAALERLDTWLLPLLERTDDWDPGNVNLSGEREADMAILGAYLVPDGFTVSVSRTENRRKSGEDYRVTVTEDFDLLELGGTHLLDFLATTFTEHEAVGRLGAIPTIEDFIDLLVAQNQAEYDAIAGRSTRGGDKDQQRAAERKKRAELERFELLDRDELLATYGDLDWLGAVLAGVAPPPEDAADRALMQDFARQFGFAEADDNFNDALLGLRTGRLLQDQLVLGDPTGGRLLFNDEMIRGTVDFGLRSGALTDAMVADALRVSESILGIDLVGGLGNPNSLDLDAPPPEFNAEAFVQALALRVDYSFLDENQVIAALAYIGGAETLGQQMERVRDSILSFQTLSVAGPPVMTAMQLERSVGSDVWDFLNSRSFERGRREKVGDDWIMDYSDVPTHLDGKSEQWDWVMEHLGVPGYHKERWNRWRLHLGVDGTGAVAGFDLERIPPKRSWLGVVFLAAFTVIAGFTGQWYMVAAIAAMQGMEAYQEGGWVAALAAVANTVLLAAGGAALAAYAVPGSAVATAATAATNSATVGAAITTAKVVSAGIGAYQAIEEDDFVDGAIAGTRALAIATGAGYIETIANAADGVDQTVEGIEDGDVAGIVAGLATTGAAAIDLAGQGGLVPDDLAEGFAKASSALTGVGNATIQVDATVQAIEDGDVAGAIQGGLSVVASTATLFGADSAGAAVLGLDEDQIAAIDTLANVAAGASTFTGSVDAAVRGDVLTAIELLAEAVVDVEGGTGDASLVAHHAEQLRALLAVAGVLVEADGDTTFSQLAESLTPTLHELGEAGKPPPENVPVIASLPLQGVAAAGEAVWDFVSPPIVEVVQPTGKGEELIIVVGGFGDSINKDIQNGLAQDMALNNPDADVLFVSWDAADEAAEYLASFGRAFPGIDVTIVGHSYGGDTAMDIARLAPDVQDIDVVTLDPVSWQQSERPDNVANWSNITVPGINSFSDFVATLGGHWGPQDGADLNIGVPDEMLNNHQDVTHHNAQGLYGLYEAWIRSQQAGPIAQTELPPLGADQLDFLDLNNPFTTDDVGSGVPADGVTADDGLTAEQRAELIDQAFNPYLGPFDVTNLQGDGALPVPPPVVGVGGGPVAVDGFFDYSTGYRSTTVATSKFGPFSLSHGPMHEEQTGYHDDTTTDVVRDGTISQVELKFESDDDSAGEGKDKGKGKGKGELSVSLSRERRAGDVSIHTYGPDIDKQASGEFEANKYEGKLTLGKRSVGANYTHGETEVDFVEHRQEADGSTTIEQGSIAKQDHTVHGVVGLEGERKMESLPSTPTFSLKFNAEAGLSYLEEQRDSVVTNSANPGAHSEVHSEVSALAIDGLAFGEGKGSGSIDVPLKPGGAHTERGSGTGTFTLYEELNQTIDHFQDGEQVGETRNHSIDSPVFSSTDTTKDVFNPDGTVASTDRTSSTDGLLSDSQASFDATYGSDGSTRIEEQQDSQGVLRDESRTRDYSYDPETGSVEIEYVSEDDVFYDTETTTVTTTKPDGSTTVTTHTYVDGPFGETETTETETSGGAGNGLP